MSIDRIGSIKDYTPNFKMIIPRFDLATWHDYIEENFRNIDALFFNLFGINNYSGPWKQITSYKKGQVLFISDDRNINGEETEYSGRLVKVLVDHTTDNSDYFSVFYNLHPEYYELFADASTAQKYAQIAQNNANSTAEMKQSVENYLRDTETLRNETQYFRDITEENKNYAKTYATDAGDFATNALNSARDAQNFLEATQETYHNAVHEINSAKSEAIIQIDDNANQKITEFDNLATQNTQTAIDLLNQTQIAAQNAQNYANEAWGKISNVGDIFYSLRLDDELNGAVVCDGKYYEIDDFTGTHSIKNLLEQNKLPYVSLSEYENTLNSFGSVRCFGYDIGGTQFRVPKLDDVYIKVGTANLPNEFNIESLPNIIGELNNTAYVNASLARGAFSTIATGGSLAGASQATGAGAWDVAFHASNSSPVYQDNAKVNPNNIRYRAFVQLANSVTEDATISAISAISKLSDASYKSKDEVIRGWKDFRNSNNPITIFQTDIIDSSTAHSDSHTKYSGIEIQDTNGTRIGKIEVGHSATNIVLLSLSVSRKVNGEMKYRNFSVRMDSSGNGWIENLRPNYGSLVGLDITLGTAKIMPNDGVLFINVKTGSQPGSQVKIFDGSGHAIGVSQHNGGSAEYHTSTFTAIVAKGQSINCTHNGKGTAAIVSSYLAPWR